jgi:transposase-like protein
MRLKHSKLTAIQTDPLCEHFVAGTPARTAAELVSVNKNTAARFYHRLREIIAAQIEDETPFQGEIEVDECYFGGARKCKRGRGAAGKVPVFGILKRGGRVYTKMIPNPRIATIIPIIEARVEPDSIVFSDSFATYDVSTSPPSRITASTTARHSSKARDGTSTASRTSGARPSDTCAATTEFPATTSISFSRNANGASTMLPQTGS